MFIEHDTLSVLDGAMLGLFLHVSAKQQILVFQCVKLKNQYLRSTWAVPFKKAWKSIQLVLCPCQKQRPLPSLEYLNSLKMLSGQSLITQNTKDSLRLESRCIKKGIVYNSGCFFCVAKRLIKFLRIYWHDLHMKPNCLSVRQDEGSSLVMCWAPGSHDV